MTSAYIPKQFTLNDLYFVSRLMNPISLSTPIRARSVMTVGQLELADALPDPDTESPEEIAIRKEEQGECNFLLSFLSPRSRDIISWRYGFENFPGADGAKENIRGELGHLAVVSHTSISTYLNLSRERVRQLENEALEKLKNVLKQKTRKEKK